VTLFFLTIAVPAFSADFRVHSVNEKERKAVLVDEETGAKWRVKEGDRVNGSIVHEIRKTHVTIVTPIDEHNGVAVVIPVLNQQHGRK